MRLFISCPLPKHICDYLTKLSSQLPSASLTVPKQFDLTVKFLGDVSENDLPSVVEALTKISFSSFTISLNGLGVFSENAIRVVWVGLVPHQPLFSLHHHIGEVLSYKFPKSNRFLPHLTLARVQKVKHPVAFRASLRAIKVEPLSFSIDRFSLIKSVLSSKGAIHTVLKEFFSVHLGQQNEEAPRASSIP